MPRLRATRSHHDLPASRRARRGAAAVAVGLTLGSITTASVVAAAPAVPVVAPTAGVGVTGAVPSARSCAATVTVRPGDGWWLIARRAGVRVGELYRLNGATVRTPLFPGRTVCVPAGSRGASSGSASGSGSSAASSGAAASVACGTSYTVRRGDSWYGIASRQRVSVIRLLAANQASTSTPLFPGRSVCLPADAASSASGTSGSSGSSSAGAPAAAPAPAPVAPTRTYSRAEVEQIVREVWPDEHEERALEIVRRESNFIPTARNWCCVGLFQIYWNVHRSWLGQIGVTSRDQLFDPRVNAQAAMALFMRSGGWGPWT